VKIRFHSDLHLEFCDWLPPAAQADVVVLAGDIHNGARGIEWARRRFPDTPILYVPGNHEFYGGELQAVLGAMHKAARRFSVELLDGAEVDLGGTRFLGATLWTDFALRGSAPAQLGGAMASALCFMNDFRLIRYGEHGLFRPEHARRIHQQQLEWLTAKLAEPFDGATVVVSHHLPHPGSISSKLAKGLLSPAFASDLSHIVRPPISLWIHGHMHDSCDHRVNGTRIVCNPRGYLPHEPNPAFDPARVIEVGTVPASWSPEQPEVVERSAASAA
jgi:Icc-related predicted phosphoesterase